MGASARCRATPERVARCNHRYSCGSTVHTSCEHLLLRRYNAGRTASVPAVCGVLHRRGLAPLSLVEAAQMAVVGNRGSSSCRLLLPNVPKELGLGKRGAAVHRCGTRLSEFCESSLPFVKLVHDATCAVLGFCLRFLITNHNK